MNIKSFKLINSFKFTEATRKLSPYSLRASGFIITISTLLKKSKKPRSWINRIQTLTSTFCLKCSSEFYASIACRSYQPGTYSMREQAGFSLWIYFRVTGHQWPPISARRASCTCSSNNCSKWCTFFHVFFSTTLKFHRMQVSEYT